MLALTTFYEAVAQEKDAEGFVSLFNGTDLTGWDGNPKFWSVRDGAITGVTTKENPTSGNTFAIWKGGTVSDFDLRLSYRVVGGNSGIQYRSKDAGNWVVGGYQADIDSGKTYSGILYEERGRGILAQRGQMTLLTSNPSTGKPVIEKVGSTGTSDELQSNIKNEDWNEYRIIAHGHQLVHLINGRVTAICVDEAIEARAASGILALQLHAGPPMTVQFKNIRMKTLH